MTDYRDVYRALGYSPVALELATGARPLPSPTLDVAFPASGFPPALVPIWIRVSDQTYVGYWQHFFCDRATTLVTCSPEDGFRAVEHARTAEQLFARTCLTLLSTWGRPTPEIDAFAATTGLDVRALDAVSAEVGDDPRQLGRFPPFRDDPPLDLAARDLAAYRGDFPRPTMPTTGEALRQVCGLELEPGLADRLASEPEAPEWLRSRDLPGTFETLLDRGDHLGAWMALNTSGWRMPQAAAALRALADRAGDHRVSVLAEAWLAEPRAGWGGW